MTQPAQPATTETISEPRREMPGWLPTAPKMIDIEGADMADEAVYRRFMARNAASQTLSMQRTEWYAKSLRMYVMIAFWIGAIGAVVGIILMIVLVNHTGTPAATDPFAP